MFFHCADEVANHSHTKLSSSNRGRLLRISQDSILDEVTQLVKNKAKHEVEDEDLVIALMGVSECD